MKARTLRLLLVITAFAFTLAACSDAETDGESHGQPETAAIFDVESGEEFPANFSLPDGSTTRIEVRFYDADGADISEELIETGHVTALTFTPGTFASQNLVTDEPFQRDVTIDADPTTQANLVIGYGHDAADEREFGNYVVTSSQGAPMAHTATR
jgi:hypothetical protein